MAPPARIGQGTPRTGRIARVAEVLRERMWVWPAVTGIVAAAAAEALVRLDRRLDDADSRPAWVFSGNADAARSVLSTIAASTMTVLGVTLSITLAVLALTAQGYSPRALRRFTRDRVIQAVISGFIGAFVFALVALRLVREDEVPGITVTVAVLLGFAVVGLVIAFFHHMASEIRVERLIDAIWEETRRAVERTLTEPHAAGGIPAAPVGAPVSEARASRTGRVCWIDETALAEVAVQSGGTGVVVPAPGDFVAEGEVVVRMIGGAPLGPEQMDRVIGAVALGTQRTMTQDVAFGVRQLADVGLRALSPGVNDPTTAEEAIMRQADILRRLADRRLGGVVTDDAGRLLVVRPRPTWDEVVGLAFDQYIGVAEAQADTATMLVLADAVARVEAATAPDRLPPLRRRISAVRAAARRALPDSADRARLEDATARPA